MKGRVFTSWMAVAVAAIAVLAAGVVLAGMGDGNGPQGAPGPGYGRHEGMHGQGPGPNGPFMEMLRSLDLTSEQRQQLHAALDRHMEGGLRAAFEAERTARQDVQRAIHDPAATDGQIVDAVRNGTGVEERLALEQRRLFEEIQALLTDEQKQELQQRHEEMLQDGGPGMGRRHRNHPED